MSTIDLVIARFGEDVSWIREVVRVLAVPVRIFVYDKGPDLSERERTALSDDDALTVMVVRLPNVGRESHTYLEHVIRMRERNGDGDGDGSTEVTVFMQGRMEDHVPAGHPDIPSFVLSMVREASDEHGRGESLNHQCHTAYGAYNAMPGLRVAGACVGDSGRDLRDWFTQVLGTAWEWAGCAAGPTWWQHGVFAVRSSRLLRTHGSVDDGYYRALRAEVDWHVNPEAGHFFERSWCFVFPPLVVKG